MKASNGSYFCGLDHIRALAAFMVFNWHFMYGFQGVVDKTKTPFFIFSFLSQGHTGVALFMTLSGYLFAKLTHNKSIQYKNFLWNRALRLMPLLLCVFILFGMSIVPQQKSLIEYLIFLLEGLYLPQWPYGTISIAIEMKYYLILPFVILIMRNKLKNLFYLIGIFISVRVLLFSLGADIEKLAYLTIIGRMDQFLFGMIAFQFSSYFKNNHRLIAVLIPAFLLMYWFLDLNHTLHPIASEEFAVTWTILTTIEGAFYGALIAWYDKSFTFSNKGFSGILVNFGKYSYSIYLFHFFVVFHMASLINDYVMSLNSFYVALPWSLLCFSFMYAPGYMSYKYIEKPFLTYRKHYLVPLVQNKPSNLLTQQANHA